MQSRSAAQTPGDRRRQLWVVGAAVCCAAAIAGCGASAKTSTTGTFVGDSQGIELADCMRAHGVSGFPDPTNSQPSITSGAYTIIWGRPGAYVAVPSTIDLRSPRFKQAAAACRAPF